MRYPKDRVAVYIDGFNLYYGALRDEPHRWLDIEALSESFLTKRQILVDVKYFTAKVKETPEKPGQRKRQEKYLRALGTLPKVSIYYGHFSTRTAIRLLEHPPKNPKKGDIGLRSVWVVRDAFNPVGIVNPHTNRTRSYALSPHQMPTGSFYRCLNKRHLRRSQLPPRLKDSEGIIRCPSGWTPKQSKK